MFILTQDKSEIRNGKRSDCIFAQGDYVRMIIPEYSFSFDLGVYGSTARAKEVLNEIFNAIKTGQRGFEMPEE
jgi:hypothetical protein